jgi:hypothetical protein
VHIDKVHFEYSEMSVIKEKYYCKNGFYSCILLIGPNRIIPEISLDAPKTAMDAVKKQNL